MTRSLLSGILVLSLGSLSACANIEYELVDHGANGHSVSGTIITDGTIGQLTTENIIAWEYTVTGPSTWSENSNELGACIHSSFDWPPTADELVIEADAKRIVMSGPGFFGFWSHPPSQVPFTQYSYQNGGSIAVEPFFGATVWNIDSPGNELVFATRPAASAGFRVVSPTEACPQ